MISYSPRNRNKGRVSPLRDEKEMDCLTASLIRDSRLHAKIRFFLVTSFHDELKAVVCVSADTRARNDKNHFVHSIVTSINHNRIHLNDFETNIAIPYRVSKKNSLFSYNKKKYRVHKSSIRLLLRQSHDSTEKLFSRTYTIA